jgi:hypothetical protein
MVGSLLIAFLVPEGKAALSVFLAGYGRCGRCALARLKELRQTVYDNFVAACAAHFQLD